MVVFTQVFDGSNQFIANTADFMTFRYRDKENVMPVRPLEPIVPPADLSPVRVRVSYRWFGGTLLNGIVGLLLMGGALYVAIDGQSKFAIVPATALSNSENGQIPGSRGRKQDKYSRTLANQAIRSIIHESNTRIVNAKEFIDVKRFARVAAHMMLTRSEETAELPAFNPLSLFAEAAEQEENRSNTDTLTSHGTINVALLPLAPTGALDDSVPIGDVEARSLVREALELSGRIGLYEVQESEDPGDEGGSGDGVISNLDGWQSGTAGADLLRVNLTEIEKSGGADAFGTLAEKVIKVETGNTISSLLVDNGASSQDARQIADAMEPVFSASRLKEGQDIRLSFGAGEQPGQSRLTRMSLYDQDNHMVTVGLGENGAFSILDESRALSVPVTAQLTDVPQAPAQARTALYYSLFETGIRQEIPEPVLNQMIRIHSYDVDFKRDTQTGDSLEVFYQMVDEHSDSDAPELLYSALTVRGETRRFYRFRTSDDGVIDYYDDEGRSAKKFLIRKPINGGVLRSPFGMRRHPILGYRKMHTGVDWTVSRGTPIVAAGNGIVEQAKWSRGYGRYTIIRHANGYKTAYAHQSAFASGLAPGVRVRQGQIIGYVGSSGLSTGPHLHYEVIVNGNFVNPMRIRVPRGRSLQGRMLAAFQRERARINRLMARPPASTQVASVTDSALQR